MWPVTNPDLAAANRALDDAESSLRRLDAACCDPGRSPRMKLLADTLAEARGGLEAAAGEPSSAATAFRQLEAVGSQVGALQVGCCAPDRLPLYAGMLQDLTEAQLSLNRALGTGH